MNKHLLFALIFFSSINLFSQIKISNYEIGYYFDINNHIIDGYFDKDYRPKKSVNILYKVGEDYTPGYYYDLNNNKINGLIKYSQSSTTFKFKKDLTSPAKLVSPYDCKSYVIGLDSFIVITDFNVERALTQIPQ